MIGVRVVCMGGGGGGGVRGWGMGDYLVKLHEVTHHRNIGKVKRRG